MDNNRARNSRIERNEDRESITSLTGIIGYSSVPDSNGDTGVYVIPQRDREGKREPGNLNRAGLM